MYTESIEVVLELKEQVDTVTLGEEGCLVENFSVVVIKLIFSILSSKLSVLFFELILVKRTIRIS